MRAEMQSGKWFWGGIALQLGLGYTVAFLVYQIGTIIIYKKLGEGFLFGLIAVLLMVTAVIILIRKADKEVSTKNIREFIRN